MAITSAEARTRILDELGIAIDQLALALACLGEAHEQLPTTTADALEDGLFRPIQRAYALGKRTHAGFASRQGMPPRTFESPSPGFSSQGVKAFVERTVVATATADRKISELQDSMLPIEAGDPELRAGLGEVRELIEPLPTAARDFLRTLGR